MFIGEEDLLTGASGAPVWGSKRGAACWLGGGWPGLREENEVMVRCDGLQSQKRCAGEKKLILCWRWEFLTILWGRLSILYWRLWRIRPWLACKDCRVGRLQQAATGAEG